MNKRQLIVTAAAVLVISAVAGSTLAEGARSSTPTALARQLAARVASARTDAARYQAVLEVMKALHVPVFTAAGKQLVPGGRDLPRSFNLYDFELRALAHSFMPTIGVEGFARMLSAGGKRVTAAAVEHALEQGIRASVARPSSQASTVGLLVRELGLRHRPASDLMRGVSADRTTLDPLQTLLIIADTAVRAAPAASRVPASAGRDTAAPCEGSTDPSGSRLGIGPKLGPIDYGEAAIAIWMKWTSLKLSTINGLPNLTHYGPPGHTPLAGRQMRFGVHAEITVDVPDSLKCGYLRVQGRQFPPKGPRSGTPVLWLTTGELKKHGTGPADPVTNEKGDAFLTFTPKNEPFPDFGSVKTAAGEVITQTPGGALEVRTNWSVKYHRPDGFKFSGLKWRIKLCCDGPDVVGFAEYEITHARKCGDDPFAPKWALIMHEVADWPGGGGPGIHRDGKASAHWTPDGPIEMEGGAFGPAPVVKLTKANGQLQASVAGNNPVATILKGGPVNVEEDLGNGAFDWSCSETVGK